MSTSHKAIVLPSLTYPYSIVAIVLPSGLNSATSGEPSNCTVSLGVRCSSVPISHKAVSCPRVRRSVFPTGLKEMPDTPFLSNSWMRWPVAAFHKRMGASSRCTIWLAIVLPSGENATLSISPGYPTIPERKVLVLTSHTAMAPL